MARDDSDFALLGDDNHSYPSNQSNIILCQSYCHQNRQLHAPRPQPPILSPPSALAASANLRSSEDDELEPEEEVEDENENDTISAFPDSNPYTDTSDPYPNNNDQTVQATTEKRRERENIIINCEANHSPYNFKRAKPSIHEFRKDREEWSDMAIGCLLDVYTEKFNQLNRGNLRGSDWEDVAAVVSERCEKQSKTVEQCKNKVDNLKKRYKLGRQKMSNGGVSGSHWPWFKRMEEVVENSLSMKVTTGGVCSSNDEDKDGCGSGGASGSTVRQSNRYAATTAVTPPGQTNNLKSKSTPTIRWRRVVLKISGVALAGTGPNNVDPKVMTLISREVAKACRLGVQVAILVGGRNFFCGDTWVTSTGSDRRAAYQIGGVALAGTGPNNVDPKAMTLISREVAKACRLGVQVAILVGGRNFFCGDTWVTSTGSDRRTAYQIGMMASVMNSILLQSSLEKMGVQTRLQTTFALPEVSETYNKRRAIRHLEKGRVVIFDGIGAGAGNPLFSTDTAAALQASEINAEALLKGTNVDGVYDCQSRDNNVTFEHISFRDLVARGATSMDLMAMTCCEENSIPVIVFNLLEHGNISKALCGEQVGTLID